MIILFVAAFTTEELQPCAFDHIMMNLRATVKILANWPMFRIFFCQASGTWYDKMEDVKQRYKLQSIDPDLWASPPVESDW